MIKVEKVCIKQGEFEIRDLSFEIPQGCYAAIMGRSGCGKTTVLEAICGLRPIQSGKITVGGTDVTTLRPGERNIAFVPQDDTLFPTLIVGEQIAFALMIRKMDPAKITEKVNAIAEQLGVAHLLERMPQGLSGGEKRRVALGRALVMEPELICLDEPLSALDQETYDDICGLFKDTIKASGITTLHVTHNRTEAHLLADKVFEHFPEM